LYTLPGPVITIRRKSSGESGRAEKLIGADYGCESDGRRRRWVENLTTERVWEGEGK